MRLKRQEEWAAIKRQVILGNTSCVFGCTSDLRMCCLCLQGCLSIRLGNVTVTAPESACPCSRGCPYVVMKGIACRRGH